MIEFISNGFSSRAVIKKGSLSLITKATIAGQYAYILDENREICTGQKTGLWFNNQYFDSDPLKGGRILIPYEQQAQYGKAILMHNGFAQLTDLQRQVEGYTLDCAVLLHPESFLMGNDASLVLKPVLKVND